jgi:hypothetical protein
MSASVGTHRGTARDTFERMREISNDSVRSTYMRHLVQENPVRVKFCEISQNSLIPISVILLLQLQALQGAEENIRFRVLSVSRWEVIS